MTLAPQTAINPHHLAKRVFEVLLSERLQSAYDLFEMKAKTILRIMVLSLSSDKYF